MTVLSAVPGYKNAAPIIALSYLDLYVQNRGRYIVDGRCFEAIQHVPEVQKMLGIPEGYTLNYILLPGLPAVKYHRWTQPEPAYVKII